MTMISPDGLAALEFELTWNSEMGKHTEVYMAEHANLWRDLLPQKVSQSLTETRPGEYIEHAFHPGELTTPYSERRLHTLGQKQFESRKINGRPIRPRYGRFYPKGLLKGLAGVFSSNVEPCRCVGVGPSRLSVDFNHPLAGKETKLKVTVHSAGEKPGDRGGRLTDWMETIADGPGMQVRANGKPTDFFSDNPFSRGDEKDDALFYRNPRLVTHVDAKAQRIIQALYGKRLKPGMKVLDLMSSCASHLPEALGLSALVGLGLNAEEMDKNPRLTESLVHDLNKDPALPFDDNSFDAVICSVSVEYMVRPFDVFQDVARLLRPGGLFIHTFSNRWFPPKAITIWTELTEFERMGLVLEYFSQSGAYKNLGTFSARGWSRPQTDRYFSDIPTADPVYAVWGERAA
ncbi:MAG: methyltransferase domain-containing protein [Thermodesulfobacteriota bacterium]|nr:methyltransferase domain-containing protein [Thermodesulfobacteriota bacterium]